MEKTVNFKTELESVKSSIGQNSLKYFVWAMVLVPVTIILHELGHYILGLVFQFPDLQLHYGSVSHNASAQDFPDWQLALQAGAGPVVTTLMTLIPCYLVSRKKSDIILTTLGLVAPIRFLVGSVYLFWLITVFFLGGTMGASNFDEYNIANFSPIPLVLLLGIETVIMLGTWWFLGKNIPEKGRVFFILSIIAGIAVGSYLWLLWIGPILLP